MMLDSGWSSGGWMLMVLLMVVFWALVVGGAIWLVRTRTRDEKPATADLGAEQILDERFARGELSEEDYRQRRAVLRTS